MYKRAMLLSSQWPRHIIPLNSKFKSPSPMITYKYNYKIIMPSTNTKNRYPCIYASANRPVNQEEKKGSVIGAVALIVGTSVGSGILALPKETCPAGYLPSSITMIMCWGVLLLEALLLVEINVGLLKENKPKTKENADDLLIISMRTMAQETLGEWGGALTTVIYVFLGYSSMVAYCSKSGEILSHLTNLPESVSSSCFIALFTVLVAVGGTRAIDEVNQWLTAIMIGLLVTIEVVAVSFGGWTGLEGHGNWEKVPDSIPVMIFALVYHDIAPVLCAYLGGDIMRIRISIIAGSLIPLLGLLVWDAIALGLSTPANDVVIDPLELLMRVRWSGLSYMIETFSLLAVGTSVIGTLLGFSGFFKEQLYRLSLSWKSSRVLNKVERNKDNIRAMALVVIPSLFVSVTSPDAFSAATDIAGGYCMTMLYGILPPAMALAMNNKKCDSTDELTMISKATPAICGVGLLASCVVIEQILHDLSELHP